MVYAPTGLYLFKKQLVIPSGVSLIGSYLSVPSHLYPANASAITDGTVLMPLYGEQESNETFSFITMSNDAAIHGLVIFYPNQVCRNAVPLMYPPTIWLNGINIFVQDIELVNSYIGIWAVRAMRHYIARIQGQPIYIGIYVDEIFDIGRIEDVHFNAKFCNLANFMFTQTTYGRSFVFGYANWQYVFNTFSWGYAIGYHFIETTGACNGNFVGIGSDYACNASLQIDASKTNGLLFTNGEFVSFHDGKFAPNSTANSSQVIINENNVGPVTFTNCAFWGLSDNILRLYSDSIVTFSGCQFVYWNETAIYAENGSLIIQANYFQNRFNRTQLQCTNGVKKVIMSNNILKYGLNANIHPSVQTAINNNL